MKSRMFLLLTLCLFAFGCDDSTNPLSDPQKAKPDTRLAGVWRWRDKHGNVTYYHFGKAGEKFSVGIMRIVEVRHGNGTVEPPQEYLAFPTVLADKTYLNVVLDGDHKQVKRLDEKGWKTDAVDCYTLIKYQVDGDKAVLWIMDETAKNKAIKDGKVKGVSKPNSASRFTDTTENVARFVAGAGDDLWDTKEPLRLEKVDAPAKKP